MCAVLSAFPPAVFSDACAAGSFAVRGLALASCRRRYSPFGRDALDGKPQKLLLFASAQEPFAHHATECAPDEAGYITRAWAAGGRVDCVDEQAFWLAHGGIWGAINSGGYYQQRLTVPPAFSNAPSSGTLWYLLVRDTRGLSF